MNYAEIKNNLENLEGVYIRSLVNDNESINSN